MVDSGPVGYDGVMKLTQRWCINPTCPYHMRKRVEMLAKYFGVVGVGPETALDMVKGHKFRNHLEALQYWFPVPPEVYLYEVAELSYIYGVDSGWKELLAGYSSFEDYFDEAGFIPAYALENEAYLKECQKFFRIRKDKIATDVLKVMITGSINGFSSKDAFLDAINAKYKDYFRVVNNKKTIRGTYCLIKEPGSVDYSKTQIALDHDIPIMSSSKFLNILEGLKGEFENENNNGGVHS